MTAKKYADRSKLESATVKLHRKLVLMRADILIDDRAANPKPKSLISRFVSWIKG